MSAQGGKVSLEVTTLEVYEPGMPPPEAPTNIIPQGGPFELVLNFKTIGGLWKSWAGDPFEVAYFAEGLGANAPEVDFAKVNGTLKTGPDVYGYNETKLAVTAAANTLIPGVYRIAACVTFPNAPGVTGFTEDLLVQIYIP